MKLCNLCSAPLELVDRRHRRISITYCNSEFFFIFRALQQIKNLFVKCISSTLLSSLLLVRMPLSRCRPIHRKAEGNDSVTNISKHLVKFLIWNFTHSFYGRSIDMLEYVGIRISYRIIGLNTYAENDYFFVYSYNKVSIVCTCTVCNVLVPYLLG